MTSWIYLLVKDNEIKGICRSKILARLINARHNEMFEIIKHEADCIFPFSIAKRFELVNTSEQKKLTIKENQDGT